MPLFQWFRKLEKRYALSFLGFLLALVFGALAIYTSFFQERKPNLKYEILSNTPVLDIHEQLSKLSIVYAGRDIKESGQSLSVMTIRIINDGQQDILKSHYDENDPVGLAIVNGEIIETPELLYASNSYLQNNLRVMPETSYKIRFSNVILERGEFFILKLLIIQTGASIPPDVGPVGKVAGIKEIEVTRPYKENFKQSFWIHTFGGNWLVQIIRIIAYTILSILALLSLIGLSSIAEKVKRRLLVKKFKKEFRVTPSVSNNLLFDRYIRKGEGELYDFESLFLSLFPKEGEENKRVYRMIWPSKENDMVEIGLLNRSDSGLKINNEAQDIFDKFMGFLRMRHRLENLDNRQLRRINDYFSATGEMPKEVQPREILPYN